MKSPANMGIIQIDITNDCFNQCSNCSRFSGNHKKIYYMDWDIFRRACESLQTEQFKGLVGIIGGEPTLHPDFGRFIKYYDNVIPHGYDIIRGRNYNVNEPINNICEHQIKHWSLDLSGKKRGLWTSFGPKYAQHFESIRDIFEYQCINDHKSSIMHQVSMLTRKELGIPDDEWKILRDSCWLQNNWSASITPKGAFFCEIAGALDMLFDGPGGWAIEAGWWKRTPKDFGDQLNWCEMCSFCLKTPYTPSHNNTDIVSPVWDKKLKDIGSKKKRIIFDVLSYDPNAFEMCKDKKEPYLANSSTLSRIGKSTARFLCLNKIIMIMVCSGYASKLRETISYNKGEVDEIIVVTEEWDVETQKLCKEFNVKAHISRKRNLNGAIFNKGAMINEGIEIAHKTYNTSWILLTDADMILPINFKKVWSKKILNPGTLYYAERVDIEPEDVLKYVIHPNKVKNAFIANPYIDRYPWGYFQLFNLNAEALKNREKPYSEEYLSAGYVDGEFIKNWHKSRWYFTGVRLLHLKHGKYGGNWNGS